MARITQHLPVEPVPFLIKALNKFDEKAKKPVSTSLQLIMHGLIFEYVYKVTSVSCVVLQIKSLLCQQMHNQGTLQHTPL